MRRVYYATLIHFFLASISHAGISNLQVNVANPNGNPIAGALVIALSFNNGNPDPLATKIGVTNSTGTYSFDSAVTNNLSTGSFYQVIVASQGFSPSIVDQFSNNPPSLTAQNPSASPVTLTLTLSSATSNSLGEIDAAIIGATPNSLVFGQVGLKSGGGAAAYGFTTTDGSGAGTLRWYNVTFASAGVYQVSAFDAQKNRSASSPVNSNLNSATTPLGAITLDFSSAPPPVSAINQSQQSGQAGGLSLDGVIIDTTTAGTPIPFVQLSFSGFVVDQFGQGRNDFRGAFADQNGRFQLYGLQPGVTYYTTIYGFCTQSGTCYKGIQSTSVSAGFGSAPGQHDFLYTSTSTILKPAIQLTSVAASTGTLAVYVQDQFGNAFSQSGVSLNPDWSPWQTSGGGSCGGPSLSNPGLTNVNTMASTGYVLITGLPSGNYQLSAFTPFGSSSFNNFTFNGNQQNGACNANNLNQQRLTITTTTAPNVRIFDIYGNATSVALSSVTLVVNISTGLTTGIVQGTLTFPGTVNLSQSPIQIALYPRCQPGSPCSGLGGFRTFSSVSTGPVINYAIAVSSGTQYFMNITSNYWGATFPGGNQPQPDLSSGTAATVNIQFGSAGRILGFLRKPDGSVFIPQTGQSIYVQASGGNSWGQASVSADGSFSIGGLLPGTYTFRIYVNNNGSSASSSSSFPYTIKQPPAQVQVAANQDTTQDAYLDNSVSIRPFISVSSLPALSLFTNCPKDNQGSCPPETWSIFSLPQGSPFSATKVTELLSNDGSSISGMFDYSPSTGQVNNCNGQILTSPGFCVTSLPANTVTGTSYDFYLARKGNFDSQNYANATRPYFVLETSTKNIVVSQSNATTAVFTDNQSGGSTATVQNIVLVPPSSMASVPQAVLAGTFTMTNIISQLQFTQLGGKFDGFLQFLPVVWVYDTSGTFRGAGLGVPHPPSERPFDAQLQSAVSSDNYNQFKILTGPNGWGPLGYEIRGLTANTTYNLVVTSPNYPPLKTSVVLGAINSTTTLNLNVDANPGASLFGIVQSTASVPILAAQVTLKAQGYKTTTLTTDSGGNWRADGLPAGQYQITVVAAGYVQQAVNANVTSNATVSVSAFSLVASNASISGTVYTNNPICPPNSTSCAAFGKTVISGATVLAYDDTVNVNNPTAVLPLYRAVTNSSGTYTLTGLKAGDIHKVFINAPGYYVLNQSTLTVSGTVRGFDFALKPKPLDINVFGRPSAPNYQFQITNFSQFSDGNAWIGTSPFTKATSTDVSNIFMQRPDGQGGTQLLLEFPLSGFTTGTVYVLHVEAQPNDPRAALVTKEITFGLDLPRNTCQSIDQILLGDDSEVNAQGLPLNQAALDISGGTGGNSSALSLPAGGVIPILSTTIPSMCMSQADASVTAEATIGVTTGAFASGVYTVTLSSINYTQKGVDLTLSYDQTGTSLDDLAVYFFGRSSQKWQLVPGLQTIDPVKATISVKGLKTLASVLDVSHGGSSLMAISDGKTYRPNLTIIRSDDTGIYAIMRPSQVSGGTYTGTTVRVFNFPNPFNLQTKNVTLNSSISCSGYTPNVTTEGTVIKYEIPAGVSGTGVIRIYTLSGRLVREIDAGNISPSTCYYTGWDGKNKNGQPVANGVYYGVLSVGGNKQSSGVFKMAVIK